MTVQDELRLSYYRQIGVLSEEHGVYIVQHTNTGKVYVKKKLTEYNANVFRYLKEHPIPHTAAIEEVVEDQDVLIVIEQFLSGQTLENYLTDHGSLSPDEAIQITQQLAIIVDALHRADPPIIHRDIKPSNIMIDSGGTVSLLDMNAAKWQNIGEAEDTKLIGTVGYAAPEQYGFGSSCRQTDIYALGILLNVMLTGEYPKIQLADGYLGTVVDKCTKINPADRYPNAQELFQALAHAEEVNTAPSTSGEITKYSLPGFRAGKVRYMIPAGVWYFLILFIGISLEVENGSTLQIWINRVFFIIMMMSVTLFSGNYLKIWDRVHLYHIKNPVLRFITVILLDLLICVMLFIVLAVIEQFIGS